MRLKWRYSIVVLAGPMAIALLLLATFADRAWRAIEELKTESAVQLVEAIQENTELRAMTLALALADMLANAVYRHELDKVGEVLAAFASKSGMEHVRVYDRTRKLLHDGTPANALYGTYPDIVTGAFMRLDRPAASEIQDGIVSAIAPIKIGRGVVGWVDLSLSLTGAERRIGEMTANIDAIAARRTRELLTTVGLTTLGLMGLGAVGAFLAARRLTRPIESLSAVARSIGEGRYFAGPEIGRRDELGDLARALDDNVRELQRSTVSKNFVDRIMTSMSDGVLVADLDGAIAVANANAAVLLGVEVGSLLSRRMSDVGLRAPDDAADSYEIERNGAAGKSVAVWVTRSVLPSQDGGAAGWVFVLRDISERKANEAVLLAARDGAEAASQAKSRFLANMSHELRTPLNAIIGFSEIMSGELMGPIGTPLYKEYAALVRDSGTHLLQVINDIVDLAKIEAGKQKLEVEAVPTADLVRSALAIVGERGRAAQLDLRFDGEGEAPTLRADRRLLMQILLNLLSNAIKFTPPGGEVAVVAERDGDGGARLEVRDTGAGMSPEEIPLALEVFGQVEGPYKRRSEGTGLGLPLVKSMAELHGATFILLSEKGHGTRAIVVFPPDRVLPPQGDRASAA